MDDPERTGEERPWEADDDLERASENVLVGWPGTAVDAPPEDDLPASDGDDLAVVGGEPGDRAAPETDAAAEPIVAPEESRDEAADESEDEGEEADEGVPPVAETSSEHAPGDLAIPPDYSVLEGEPRGGKRAVGIVVSRFNGEVTGALLQSALDELEVLRVSAPSITAMPVPGAFELPIAAMALAKTRRFACVVALGCVIRGDTPHFDYVASEAASGLQLAAIETGVPVAFGVLTLDRPDQAEPRFDKGAEAVRTALEMADLFANLRAAAAR
jgi:6,7-dimethyl-8-ribityllumazine synthase